LDETILPEQLIDNEPYSVKSPIQTVDKCIDAIVKSKTKYTQYRLQATAMQDFVTPHKQHSQHSHFHK